METTLELPSEIAAAGARSLRERQAATIATLDSFMEQDEDEHRETLRVLRQSLDEDRPGERRIFNDADGSKWDGINFSCRRSRTMKYAAS